MAGIDKKKVNLIFRHPAPQFNSIETVFNAVIPYLQEEFDLNIIYLPYRTTGIGAMRKNLAFVREMKLEGLTHITGHENYIIRACAGKTILTVHDIGSASIGKPIRDFFINRYWFKIPMRYADVVTVISDFSGKEISERYPFIIGKTRVVPNPVDDSITYCPKEFNVEKPIILLVGTKVNKNLERTLEALVGARCRLYILGILSLDQKELLSDLGIEYENYFHMDYKDVIKLYCESDMVMFASLYEGFGMPILEAQATGRPVLTSNVAAMPETAGDSAAIVDPYDVDDIRNAAMRIIQDGSYRDDLIRKGLENVEHFRAKNIARLYMDIYNEMLL